MGAQPPAHATHNRWATQYLVALSDTAISYGQPPAAAVERSFEGALSTTGGPRSPRPPGGPLEQLASGAGRAHACGPPATHPPRTRQHRRRPVAVKRRTKRPRNPYQRHNRARGTPIRANQRTGGALVCASAHEPRRCALVSYPNAQKSALQDPLRVSIGYYCAFTVRSCILYGHICRDCRHSAPLCGRVNSNVQRDGLAREGLRRALRPGNGQNPFSGLFGLVLPWYASCNARPPPGARTKQQRTGARPYKF